jgi:phthiodiolone/phenolphthiodiolone dimycocerosates ketoreductase
MVADNEQTERAQSRKLPSIGTAGTVYPPLDRLLDNARRAESAGFASIWWPDHFMGWHPESLWTDDITPIARRAPSPHVFLDPIACIAAAATVTESALLGTSVTFALHKHPVVLAREFLTLDHFSEGRAILGIGAGEGENTVPYGIDFSSPVAKLEEALEIVRAFFDAEGPLEFQGRYYRLKNAVLGLRPCRDKPPPIWLAAHGPRMLALCGRLADGWLPTALPLEEYSEKLAILRGFAAKAGRDPTSLTAAMFCYCVPAADHETAHRVLENPIVKGFCMALGAERFESMGFSHPLGTDFYGLRDYVPAGIPRSEALSLMDSVPFEVAHEFIWHGTLDELLDDAAAFVRAGGDHLVLWNVAPFDRLISAAESFAILEEVAKRCKEESR